MQINGHFFRVCILRRLGPSLGAELRLAEADKVTLDGPTALRIALPLIDSLEFLHSRGYAHADIKPANVCYGQYAGDGTRGTFTDKDRLFLIDFGLASPFRSVTHALARSRTHARPPARTHSLTHSTPPHSL